ncbi:MAG: hypothetical protein AAF558_04365 [Verrucomicrobiota bacterium]
MQTVEDTFIIQYPCGVVAEYRQKGDKTFEARLRDANGPGFFAPAHQPLYLDHHKAGSRYLLTPAAPGTPISEAMLSVIGEVYKPEFNDKKSYTFSEDWHYVDVEYFTHNINWELVKKDNILCHRLIQNGHLGEWAHAHQHAFLDSPDDIHNYMILTRDYAGKAPSKMLLEVLHQETGALYQRPESLEGYLYLSSEHKETSGLPDVVAEARLKQGRIKNINILLGNSSAYSRFPDLGDSDLFVFLWCSQLAHQEEWPCVHHVLNWQSRRWDDVTDLETMRNKVCPEPLPHDWVCSQFVAPEDSWRF